MDLQKLRIGIGLMAVFMIILTLMIWFDFSDFSWENNKSNYIGLLTGVLIAISALSSYFKEKGKVKEQ